MEFVCDVQMLASPTFSGSIAAMERLKMKSFRRILLSVNIDPLWIHKLGLTEVLCPRYLSMLKYKCSEQHVHLQHGTNYHQRHLEFLLVWLEDY